MDYDIMFIRLENYKDLIRVKFEQKNIQIK